jgi:hypothetical protein
LPINYWFEYLDLVFLFKCVHGLIKVDISQYVNFTEGRSQRGKTGLYLDSQYARTSCYRDTYFMRITNLWNAIPEALISAGTLKSFERDLNIFFFSRLQMVFEGDNVKTYKIVCPKLIHYKCVLVSFMY